MTSQQKDLRRLEKAALDQGWTIVKRNGKTLFVPVDPDKNIVTVHGTPSDRRALANTIAELRRSGLRV